jgi:prepilin-type N-terminal cleavage/methylation domain-containing protein
MSVRRGGFTLVEVLAALAVLAIGLTTVVSLLISSIRLGSNTTDRNVAKAIIAEAMADIERAHLITSTMDGMGLINPNDVGLLIETVHNTPAANPSIHSDPYRNVRLNGSAWSFDAQLDSMCAKACFSGTLDKATSNVLIWPFNNTAQPYFSGVTFGAAAGSVNDKTSYAYRVLYRLERDPRWHPHNADCTSYDPAEVADSPFAGSYLLTLVVYRDIDRTGGRLEQITDPQVVYLRDRKVR